MILQLAQLPPNLRGPAGDDYHGKVPTRARFLAPDAAASLLRIESETGGLVYTDIFRDAGSALRAYTAKSGTKRPGYTPHGFGLAVDLDVDATCKLRGWNYDRLVAEMKAAGWCCHRRDGLRGAEDWHFNYLGAAASLYLALASTDLHATWDKPVEARIVERYGTSFALDKSQAQAALAKLGYHPGAVDGIFGRNSVDALAHFQAEWSLLRTSLLDEMTQRTLAYVAAEVAISNLQSTNS